MRDIWVFLWGIGGAGTGQRLEVVRWRQIELRGKIVRGKEKEAKGKTRGYWSLAVCSDGRGGQARLSGTQEVLGSGGVSVLCGQSQVPGLLHVGLARSLSPLCGRIFNKSFPLGGLATH